MPTKSKVSVPDQIKKALDGRTQRWLANKIGVSDYTMSVKMNGETDFTENQICKIEEVLGVIINRK